jgi:hypothetical protein
METMDTNKEYDPAVLVQCLTELSQSAEAARDCFLMNDEAEGRKEFNKALSALCKSVAQLSLLNRK